MEPEDLEGVLLLEGCWTVINGQPCVLDRDHPGEHQSAEAALRVARRDASELRGLLAAILPRVVLVVGLSIAIYFAYAMAQLAGGLINRWLSFLKIRGRGGPGGWVSRTCRACSGRGVL